MNTLPLPHTSGAAAPAPRWRPRLTAALAAPVLGALLLAGCAGPGDDDGVGDTDGDEATTAPVPSPQGPDDDEGDEPDSDVAQTELDGAGDDEDGDEDGDTGIPEPTPQQVEEAPELVDEVQATWEGYEELSETELEVMFYSGNPNCYGVRSVVEEDAEEVRIATISGRLPEAADQPCTQEALYVSVVVELEEPLGDREVVELQDVELD